MTGARAPRRSRWGPRLLLAVGSPLLLLAAIELALAAVGVGGPSPLFERDPNDPARRSRAPRYHFFFAPPPAPHLAVKPANGFRVAVVGESTVAGYPYFFATFCDWLAAELTDLLPDRVCEVLNGGVVGWPMRRLRAVVDACIDESADVVVIMTGHNEERAADNVMRLRERAERPIRSAVGEWLVGRRLVGLLSPPAVHSARAFPAALRREDRRIGIEEPLIRTQFRRELDEAARDVLASGARLVLATMPRQLRVARPHGSSFAPGLDADARARVEACLRDGESAIAAGDAARALALADEALALDAVSADVRFLRARALEAAGRCPEAAAEYRAALERDAWPLRAREWVETTIREVARERGAVLVDVAAKFDEHGRCGVAGDEWLGTEVHPNLDGHRAISRLLVDGLADAGIPAPRAAWRWDARRSDDAIRLGFGTSDAFAFSTSRAAGYGRLFDAFSLPFTRQEEMAAVAAEARDHLARANALMPSDVRVAVLLGVAEVCAGDREGGARRLRASLESDPTVAREFAAVAATGAGLRKTLSDAGVDVAAYGTARARSASR